jgi:hypothetical protein
LTFLREDDDDDLLFVFDPFMRRRRDGGGGRRLDSSISMGSSFCFFKSIGLALRLDFCSSIIGINEVTIGRLK